MESLKRLALAAAFCAASIPALAADDWALLTSNSGVKVWVRSDSFAYRQESDGLQFVTVIARNELVENGQVQFLRYVVTGADCDAGFGALMMLELNSKPYGTKDFVLRGGTVASHVADFLCARRATVKPVRSGT